MSSHIFEMKQFKIEDRTYQFRRLGTKAARHLIELVKTAWKNGVLDLSLHLEQMSILANKEFKQEEVTPGLMLFFSAEHCLEQFLDLMEEYLLEVKEDGTLERVSYEDLTEGDKFPLYSLVPMTLYFMQHPDLSMFSNAIKEGKDLPFLQSLLAKVKKASQVLKTDQLES